MGDGTFNGCLGTYFPTELIVRGTGSGSCRFERLFVVIVDHPQGRAGDGLNGMTILQWAGSVFGVMNVPDKQFDRFGGVE